jgi:hypothetical protein
MNCRLFLVVIFVCLPLYLLAQDETATIYGKITDPEGKPVFLASITVVGTSRGTVTNEKGLYELVIPSGQDIQITFSCLGYDQSDEKVLGNAGTRIEINKTLGIATQNMKEVTISEDLDRGNAITRINIKTLDYLPSTTGGVEAILKTLPGVVSTSELSSQYSVRGGSFDENLVYVNDIEIFRPFLIRSGQQEGLSFINSDMVSSVKFSAGGFEASYGDRISSVLDVVYRRPGEFAGSASVSLLGGSLHLEGASKKQRFTHTSGIRYKTTRYLLSSMETKGEYIPDFLDFQTYLTYDISDKTELSFLGNIANNKYRFIPESRSTDFGTFQNPLNLVIYYDGQEMDRFNTYTGAFTTLIRPREDLSLKFILSAFSSIEEEKFDIQGQYWINELDNKVGSKTYGDSILNIGIGTFLDHARNYLDAYIYSASYIGVLSKTDNITKWGIQWQHEVINDKLSEWEMIDSSGYSIPYSDKNVLLNEVVKSNNRLITNRFTSYLQNTRKFEDEKAVYYFNSGLRISYWDMNQQFLLSPRISLSLKPFWKKNIMFRFSAGYYYQPPFYKEMRYPDGSLNRDIRAQKSIHLVTGSDMVFSVWNRPFKFTTEIYYKHLKDIIPYKLDNVRIKYMGENKANGYAAGLEMKLHGEFVPGAESWVSVSIMKTEEDIIDDYIYKENREPGYYPRPMDQRLNFGLFFQDYFPNHPDYKVHLNVLYGTGLPFSPPDNKRYDLVFRMPSYKRVDIGLSKSLKREGKVLNEKKRLNFFKEIWLNAEIFNLLGINNTISYLWVKTVFNQEDMPGEFGVPNYLTSRRFNLRITAKF